MMYVDDFCYGREWWVGFLWGLCYVLEVWVLVVLLFEVDRFDNVFGMFG